MKTITYNPETHVLVPRDLIADAKQIFCSDVEPNTNGDCLDVIEWFNAMIATAPQPEQVESEPVAEHELQDTRCECCGYMTYHREHMGCIRSSMPQPDRTAELEQLRQRFAELEDERDELKLVVSAHADFFSRTQSEMADLKESVECLSATNGFLAGKRDENIILKAAVKQLTAERDAAITNLRVEQIAHLSLTDLLEKENVQLKSALKVAKAALNIAADRFHDYAEIHAAKEASPENDLKVERNLMLSSEMDKALDKINEVLSG